MREIKVGELVSNRSLVFDLAEIRAKRVWQEMFALYRDCGGDLEETYELLVDYDHLNSARNFDFFDDFEFVWGFCRHGRTEFRIIPEGLTAFCREKGVEVMECTYTFHFRCLDSVLEIWCLSGPES